MIEIEHGRLRKYPHDRGSPACVIMHSIAFTGVEGEIGCPDSFSPGFIVGAKTFFRRQRKGFGLTRLHPRHPLLKRWRDNMLTLYKLLGIAVGRGEVITERDFILHRHFCSVPHHIAVSFHWSWICLDNIQHEPLPQEQGCADRTQEDDKSCRHAPSSFP